MKRLLPAMLIILSLASVAQAAPFLVSDPQIGVTYYRVSLDGGVTWSDSTPDPTGQYGVKLDLVGITDGVHNVKAQACNIWGCSTDSSPFAFDVQRCGAPQMLRLLNE